MSVVLLLSLSFIGTHKALGQDTDAQTIDFNIPPQPHSSALASGVRLLGGISLIDTTLVRTAGGLNDGRTAPGIPDINYNLYGEYDLPFAWTSGLTMTGR